MNKGRALIADAKKAVDETQFAYTPANMWKGSKTRLVNAATRSLSSYSSKLAKITSEEIQDEAASLSQRVLSVSESTNKLHLLFTQAKTKPLDFIRAHDDDSRECLRGLADLCIRNHDSALLVQICLDVAASLVAKGDEESLHAALSFAQLQLQAEPSTMMVILLGSKSVSDSDRNLMKVQQHIVTMVMEKLFKTFKANELVLFAKELVQKKIVPAGEHYFSEASDLGHATYRTGYNSFGWVQQAWVDLSVFYVFSSAFEFQSSGKKIPSAELRRYAKLLMNKEQQSSISVRLRAPLMGSVKADGLGFTAWQVITNIEKTAKAPGLAIEELQQAVAPLRATGIFPTGSYSAQYDALAEKIDDAEVNIVKAVETFANGLETAITEAFIPADHEALVETIEFATTYKERLEAFFPDLLEDIGCADLTFYERLSLSRSSTVGENSEKEKKEGDGPHDDTEQLWQQLTLLSWCMTALHRISSALSPNRKNAEFSGEIQQRLEVWRLTVQLQLDILDSDTDADESMLETLQEFSNLWARWCEIGCINYSDQQAMRIITTAPGRPGRDCVADLGIRLRNNSIKEFVLAFIGDTLAEVKNDVGRTKFLDKFETLKHRLPSESTAMLDRFVAYLRAQAIKSKRDLDASGVSMIDLAKVLQDCHDKL